MATNTYTALATQTLGTAASSVTFSSIPAGYTDLVLVANFGITNDGYILGYRLNSDTGTNYSWTYLRGNGSSASSSRKSGMSLGSVADEYNNDNYNTAIINLQNYSNTTTNKTVIARSGNAAQSTAATVSLWRSTAAITSITLAESGDGGTGTFGTGNLTAGSTFTIYGIAAASVGAKATGGTIYSDALYYYHAFAANGTFTPTQSISADCLVVAGGGSGGAQNGAGGGAGGLLAFSSQSLTATGYTVTVGAGGTSVYQGSGTNGSNSQFGALTASVGGGAGGFFWGGGSGSGGTGGSGGGGMVISTAGGSGTSGQGYAGGNGLSTDYAGAGGGGAGAVGGSVITTEVGGAGGIGATSSFINAVGVATGLGQLSSGNYYFAGGGGGGGDTTPGAAGLGGGGIGKKGSQGTGGAGTVNTGGGGGAARGGSAGGAGGSGLVIVRYAK